jgi:formylglycine-generating enzyme required for sulfatase activity
MGSTEEDNMDVTYKNVAKPRHLVSISRPFYLGVYPVTQGEYRQVIKNVFKKNPGVFGGDPGLLNGGCKSRRSREIGH